MGEKLKGYKKKKPNWFCRCLSLWGCNGIMICVPFVSNKIRYRWLLLYILLSTNTQKICNHVLMLDFSACFFYHLGRPTYCKTSKASAQYKCFFSRKSTYQGTCHHFLVNENVSLCQAASTNRTSSTKEKIKSIGCLFLSPYWITNTLSHKWNLFFGGMRSFMFFQVRLDTCKIMSVVKLNQEFRISCYDAY